MNPPPATNLQVFSAGRNIVIKPGTELTGAHRMAFGDDVFIGRDSQIMLGAERAAPGPQIVFGRGTSINRRALIVAVNEIVFGEYVLTAPGIYVADSSHEYRNVGVPVTMQGLEPSSGRVHVGDHAWIGIHVAIVGNLSIGRGAVIGANAVVTRSIPDYCIAAGQPARVVRAYDDRPQAWVKIGSDDHLAEVLANGRTQPISFRTIVPPVPIYNGPTVTIQ
jgi:acetyltransferase-like isoleucine patch superfamily enzyme